MCAKRKVKLPDHNSASGDCGSQGICVPVRVNALELHAILIHYVGIIAHETPLSRRLFDLPFEIAQSQKTTLAPCQICVVSLEKQNSHMTAIDCRYI